MPTLTKTKTKIPGQQKMMKLKSESKMNQIENETLMKNVQLKKIKLKSMEKANEG